MSNISDLLKYSVKLDWKRKIPLYLNCLNNLGAKIYRYCFHCPQSPD